MEIKENYFSTLYLFIGLLSLFFFTWTGKYLGRNYPDKHNLEMAFRVMLRSRHIFILLVSLIEIAIGVYIQQSSKMLYLSIQWLATMLLVVAHALFIYAFFYEVEIIHIPKTPILHYATYFVLASLILHLLTKFESKFK
jgi:magnesium-transporting ATPase (P-type)